MLKAIKHALTNLTNFTGRDARQAFWYYVLFLVILNMAVGFLMTIPMIASSFQTAFQAARMGVSQEDLALQMSSQMGDQMVRIMWVSIAVNLITAVLLVAAFVRRLHDSDHSGWWAVAPIVAQVAAATVSIGRMDSVRDLMAASMNPQNMQAYLDNEVQMLAYGLVGWIGPIIVIIFGVMKSTQGPNRYGDTPFTA